MAMQLCGTQRFRFRTRHRAWHDGCKGIVFLPHSSRRCSPGRAGRGACCPHPSTGRLRAGAIGGPLHLDGYVQAA